MTSPPAAAALGFTLLMFLSGMGIPVMASLNAGLGQQIGSPVAAVVILFAIGLAITAGALTIAGPPSLASFTGVPRYFYAGAVFMAFYILAITWSAPRIGLGNAIFLVLLGQIVAAAAIDHFGLFRTIPTPLTARRFAGLLIMVTGICLARKPR